MKAAGWKGTALAVSMLMAGALIGCQSVPKRSEKEALAEISGLGDSAQKVAALQQFLSEFPESSAKSKVRRQIFGAYVELADGEQAAAAAEAALAELPEAGRADLYNSFAWQLAEAGLALEKAEAYASRAVELTKAAGGRRYRSNLDTYAYVVYRRGDAARAETLQREVLQGGDVQADYLERLALYQHAGGKTEESLDTLAQSLLIGGTDQGWDYLTAWVTALDPDAAARQRKLLDLLGRRIGAFLAESDTPKRRGRAAALLGRSGADVAMAERWARKALADLGPEAPEEDEFEARRTLASILATAGKTDEILAILQAVQSRAPLWDADYWQALGQALQAAGRRDEAMQAWVEGALIGRGEKLRAALRGLSLSDAEIETRIAARKADLLKFDPGQWSGSTDSGGPVALAELFTGAECNPCQAADQAFDLLSHYYPRSRLALLEYHLHIPGADPMTNPSSLARYQYYGAHFGTPTAFINGGDRATGGGPALLKQSYFERYRSTIEAQLEHNTAPNLGLVVRRDGDGVTVTVDTNPLGKETSRLNLHVALVEKSVAYLGGNTIDHHAFVVRHLTDGMDGVALERPKVGIVIREIRLDQVEAGLKAYLDQFEQSPPDRYKGFGGWNERPETLDRANLAIVAWVQDRETQVVVQAAYAEI